MESFDTTSSEEHVKKSDASASNLPEEPLKHYVQNALSRIVKRLFGSLQFSIFKETYPELYKQNKSHLKEIHSQLKSQLMDTFLAIENDLCNEVNLYPLLSALDNLIKSHTDSSDEVAWRPSGDPKEDIRDHLHQMKLKHKKCLEFTLQTFTLQNESLAKIMEEKHQEIVSIKGSIGQTSKDIKNQFENLNDGSISKLEKKISSLLDS